MLRRDFLKTAIAPIIPWPRGSPIRDYGWLPPLLPSIKPSFLDIYPQLEGIGQGKVVLLYKYIEKILKQSLPAHKQTGSDCTSQAAGLGIDFIQAIQAILCKDRWISKVATEMLHIGSRKLIGKRVSGGVTIDESIDFLTKWGVLFRKKYKNYDFRKYNYKNCKQLIRNNIPEWLLKECKKHLLLESVKIKNWNDARDAIRNLCPIVIGSKVGFDNAKRDIDGFAKPKGIWAHAWLLIAIDDRYKRPGGCLMNSHGDNWVKGPRRHKQPKGSIWVDQSVINEMISKYKDSFALVRLGGLKPIKYNLWPRE